ncbi:MAG: hypothetical protein PUE01_07765 [Clostridiaceae bacterium]|nr:hypothetical protein [Clostridiaceae bacterium]
MLKYSFYKNFIPSEFINEKLYKNEISDRRSITILAVLCLLIFPFAISNLNNHEEVLPHTNVNRTEDLNQWDKLINKGFQGKYTNEKAIITIEKKEDLDKLLQDKNISVEKIEHRNDEIYEIEIIKR